jgi:hypothetical protein
VPHTRAWLEDHPHPRLAHPQAEVDVLRVEVIVRVEEADPLERTSRDETRAPRQERDAHRPLRQVARPAALSRHREAGPPVGEGAAALPDPVRLRVEEDRRPGHDGTVVGVERLNQQSHAGGIHLGVVVDDEHEIGP